MAEAEAILSLSPDRIQEVRTKLALVRDWLGRAGVDGVLLESSTNFGWITAGGQSHIITSEDRGAASVLITAGTSDGDHHQHRGRTPYG